MNDIISLQLYSVRDEAQKGFDHLFKIVSEAGFTGVEFAGYKETPAKEMAELLKKYNLTVTGAHVPYERIINNTEEEMEYSSKIGNKYIVCPWGYMQDEDELKSTCENLNRAGEILKRNGFVLAYHNHKHEFARTESGEYYLDYLYNNTNPEYLKAQLDIFWVYKGGEDPVSYIKKYSGRIPLIHLKDVDEDGENCVVGDGGVISIPEIIKTGKECGTEFFAIEQEKYTAGTSIETARLGASYLKTVF